ncbi:SpoIIE family protein phosphatase [Streptosporangium sp. NPDC020072]|uniref:SpoIIE family protein phosphatase n=1 Tax=Streptosporangium sp. NPDC020072 TaxID=3154788 RepID=UPI0034411AE8
MNGSRASWKIRYDREAGSAFETDEFRRYDLGGPELLALVDSNGVPAAQAARVRSLAFDSIAQAAGDDICLPDLLDHVRSVVTKWFDTSDLPPTGCFLNVALLRLGEKRVTLVGAYAPVYILSASQPTRYIDFPGPVLGPHGMLKHPIREIEIQVEADEYVLVPSDGLLESRTPEGKINGDTHLKRRVEEFFDAEDLHTAVLRTYREHDADLRDSRSLLSINWTG